MAENKNMKGTINSLNTYHTDAYMIAVKNGFNGSEAKWLESLNGKDGKDGISPTVDIVAINGGYRITITDKNGTKSFDNVTTTRLSSISLSASAWKGDKSPYSQEVEISDVTEYTKVDLLPSVDQLAIFHDKDLAFVTENKGGVVTVYAIGDKPTGDYDIQVALTEVRK